MSNSITVHGQEIKYAHRPEFFKKVEEGKWGLKVLMFWISTLKKV